MSGRGAPDAVALVAGGLRVAIVAASRHATIMDGLVPARRGPVTRRGPNPSS